MNWYVLEKRPDIKPFGKLKRVTFPASADKIFVDEMCQLFKIDFKSGQKTYIGSTFKI